MSPLVIRRLVGHPDIVERLRDAANGMCGLDNERGDFGLCDTAADEVERLRAALRAVRGCSDPAWAARIINEVLGETTP